MSRLPFLLLENPEFHRLIDLARVAPSRPEFPSARTARRRLENIVKQKQEGILQKLPPSAKLSIALDCWTSPFQQAFMAITGYFIDDEWNYREVLLGFEPLYRSHTGANLSEILFDLLQRHQITKKVLAITTDNASNNETLMTNLLDLIESSELGEKATIVRIPCIAHIIQLSLKELLGEIKAEPKNDTIQMEWAEPRSQARGRHQTGEIADTLNKVSSIFI